MHSCPHRVGVFVDSPERPLDSTSLRCSLTLRSFFWNSDRTELACLPTPWIILRIPDRSKLACLLTLRSVLRTPDRFGLVCSPISLNFLGNLLLITVGQIVRPFVLPRNHTGHQGIFRATTIACVPGFSCIYYRVLFCHISARLTSSPSYQIHHDWKTLQPPSSATSVLESSSSYDSLITIRQRIRHCLVHSCILKNGSNKLVNCYLLIEISLFSRLHLWSKPVIRRVSFRLKLFAPTGWTG